MPASRKAQPAPIIFFGNERLATGLTDTVPLAFQRLVAAYPIAAVVTPFTPGRSRNARPLEIEVAARAKAVPVINPPHKQALLELIVPYQAKLGVLVAFGMIVPPELIASFEYGIINLHPSLLPRYRGPIPIEQALLDGASETGVSIMQLDQGMDTGPVLAQRAITVSVSERKAQLAGRLHQLGAELLAEQVAAVLAGTARPVPQDDSLATTCPPLAKSDGLIDWRTPAVQLEREVRAYLGWPGSRTQLWSHEVTVTEAALVEPNELTSTTGADHVQLQQPGTVLEGWPGRLLVATGDGALELRRLKPAGKREMSVAEFLRGRR